MGDLQETSPFLNEQILKCLEQAWEFNFPKSYREFLIKYNGGYPDKKYFSFKDKNDGSVLQAFLGFTPKPHLNILKELNIYKNRIPNNMFPIAYDIFGNLILIGVKNPDRGKIYFWDHEMEAGEGEEPTYDNLTLIADSFDEFISSLKDYDI